GSLGFPIVLSVSDRLLRSKGSGIPRWEFRNQHLQTVVPVSGNPSFVSYHSLPVGYHFSPSDEELVEFYLPKKVRGEGFPYNVIPDCDLYGDKAPWEMFPRDAGTGRDRFFVFTQLKWLSKKRVSRSAPIFYGKNNKIGTRKQFVFKVKKGKEGSSCGALDYA
ncbi:unnamed protein product, partial [Linum tenue]